MVAVIARRVDILRNHRRLCRNIIIIIHRITRDALAEVLMSGAVKARERNAMYRPIEREVVKMRKAGKKLQ